MPTTHSLQLVTWGETSPAERVRRTRERTMPTFSRSLEERGASAATGCIEVLKMGAIQQLHRLYDLKLAMASYVKMWVSRFLSGFCVFVIRWEWQPGIFSTKNGHQPFFCCFEAQRFDFREALQGELSCWRPRDTWPFPALPSAAVDAVAELRHVTGSGVPPGPSIKALEAAARSEFGSKWWDSCG